MKVLYVNKVSPRFGGGAELRLREIGKRLVKKGHEVYVVCGKTEPHLPDYEEIDGLKIYYVRTIPQFIFRFKRLSFYLSRYLFYVLSLRKILEIGENADLIVDDISPAPSLAYLAGKVRGKPIYATVHEFFGSRWFELKDPLTACIGFLTQYLLKLLRFSKLITVSQFTKSRLVNFGLSDKKIFVIPNGIDVSSYENNNAPQKDSIISLGRLVKQKGCVYLIEAMEKVIEEVPDAKLNIVGDGPLKEQLAAKVKVAGLDRNITFLGKVSEDKKREVLSKSQIFVMPSLQEGFGIVLLEAMACGLPIIANDLPVFREIFTNGQNGYLVDVKDSEGLAKKIIELFRDEPKREQIGNYNREYVTSFDWDRVAELEEKTLLLQ